MHELVQGVSVLEDICTILSLDLTMPSLQESRAKLASHFASDPAADGQKWAQLWDQGDFLPWDRRGPNPAFEDFLAQSQDLIGHSVIKDPNGNQRRKKALVPGCGRGYDVLLLASFGYDAVGLEVSETAVKRCWEEKEKNGGEYPVMDEDAGAGDFSFVQGDFFKSEWLRPDVGKDGVFDLIYDYTFLSALRVEMRPAWALRMSQLLSETGQLICIEFPSNKDPKLGGPPFSLPPPVYVEHLGHPGEVLPYDEGTGHVLEGSSSKENAAALKRIAHWQPVRTHEIGIGPDGKVVDWISVWQH